MWFQISNLRKTKVEGTYTFTVIAFLGEKDWVMLPGFRIGKSTLWAPSRKAGNFWPKNVHMSEGAVAKLVDAVAKEADKLEIPLDKNKALKSLKADPVDLLVVASDSLPEEVREKAEEILAKRKAFKAEKDKLADAPKRRLLTF